MMILRCLLAAFLLLMVWSSNALALGDIVVVKVDGAINPVVAEFVTDEIGQANLSSAELVVIQMDTPGGLDTSMRQIIKVIQSSKIPVASFVSPGGSRAAPGIAMKAVTLGALSRPGRGRCHVGAAVVILSLLSACSASAPPRLDASPSVPRLSLSASPSRAWGSSASSTNFGRSEFASRTPKATRIAGRMSGHRPWPTPIPRRSVRSSPGR